MVTKELIDTLLAISVVAKRLATNLAKEELKNGTHDENYQRPVCPYCCTAGVHGTDH
jgi:hypothetical protein